MPPSTPDKGIILSRIPPKHGKPSRLTIAVAGSTVAVAAVTSATVAVWPANAWAQQSAAAQQNSRLQTGGPAASAAEPGRAATHAVAAADTAAHRRAVQAAAPAPAQPSGSPQQIATAMLGSFGWPASEFGYLNDLWTRESGWNPTAANASGAYGIPQALPGSKMASAGADWQTNPATQIRWGLGYIKGLYGSPCGAWSHSQATGWY